MTSEQLSALGTRMRALREQRKMSLGKLEEASGVSKGYLSQLERGEATNPSVDAAQKIALGLGVHVSELLGEQQPAMGHQKLPKGLKEFLRNYPQSQLKSDAEQAQALLKEGPSKP